MQATKKQIWTNVWVVIELAIGMKPNRKLRIDRTVRCFASKAEAIAAAAPGAAIAKFRVELESAFDRLPARHAVNYAERGAIPTRIPVSCLHGGKLVHNNA